MVQDEVKDKPAYNIANYVCHDFQEGLRIRLGLYVPPQPRHRRFIQKTIRPILGNSISLSSASGGYLSVMSAGSPQIDDQISGTLHLLPRSALQGHVAGFSQTPELLAIPKFSADDLILANQTPFWDHLKSIEYPQLHTGTSDEQADSINALNSISPSTTDIMLKDYDTIAETPLESFEYRRPSIFTDSRFAISPNPSTSSHRLLRLGSKSRAQAFSLHIILTLNTLSGNGKLAFALQTSNHPLTLASPSV